MKAANISIFALRILSTNGAVTIPLKPTESLPSRHLGTATIYSLSTWEKERTQN
jgi:hypothetical protein